MNESLFGTIFVCGLFGFAFICIAIISIWGWVQTYKEKQKRKAHPYYFQKLKELNDLISESCSYYNTEIAPLKRLIDRILKEWDYYPEEMRERKTDELELYRRRIHEHQQVCDKMDMKKNELRAEMKAYNEKYHLYEE